MSVNKIWLNIIPVKHWWMITKNEWYFTGNARI